MVRGTRLDILEQRFEYLDRDVLKAIDAESSAVIDAEPEPPHVPTLALATDGRVLLSVHYVEGADISERQTWTGIILTEAEACDALDMMSDAADDTAGHVGVRIIANSKKRELEGACASNGRRLRFGSSSRERGAAGSWPRTAWIQG